MAHTLIQIQSCLFNLKLISISSFLRRVPTWPLYLSSLTFWDCKWDPLPLNPCLRYCPEGDSRGYGTVSNWRAIPPPPPQSTRASSTMPWPTSWPINPRLEGTHHRVENNYILSNYLILFACTGLIIIYSEQIRDNVSSSQFKHSSNAKLASKQYCLELSSRLAGFYSEQKRIRRVEAECAEGGAGGGVQTPGIF